MSTTNLTCYHTTSLDTGVLPVYYSHMAKRKITPIDFGSLLLPLKRRLSKTGETLSAYVRRLVANDLGRPEPKFDGSGKGLKKYNRERKRKARK